MPIHHKARTGKTYYLHVKRKDEMVNYFFSMDPNGQLADAVPEGYEIYENIGGQVFLLRKAPQVISEAELALVVEALKSPSKGQFYKLRLRRMPSLFTRLQTERSSIAPSACLRSARTNCVKFPCGH